jgi:hypothetical protein
MSIILKPPQPLEWPEKMPSVFLAGSIDMGLAEPWQAYLEEVFSPLELAVLNPRRDDWDSSWKQELTNPPFVEQVQWELEAQERASLIVMYFAPQSQAPITLLELGLFAHTGKMLVCCPEGYWRKGNVDVVCQRYGIPQVSDLEMLGRVALERLGRMKMPPGEDLFL